MWHKIRFLFIYLFIVATDPSLGRSSLHRSSNTGDIRRVDITPHTSVLDV